MLISGFLSQPFYLETNIKIHHKKYAGQRLDYPFSKLV